MIVAKQLQNWVFTRKWKYADQAEVLASVCAFTLLMLLFPLLFSGLGLLDKTLSLQSHLLYWGVFLFSAFMAFSLSVVMFSADLRYKQLPLKTSFALDKFDKFKIKSEIWLNRHLFRNDDSKNLENCLKTYSGKHPEIDKAHQDYARKNLYHSS
jgi:hypothetical protein